MCLNDLRAAGVTRCVRTVILNSMGSTEESKTVLSCFNVNGLSPQTEALSALSLSGNTHGSHPPRQKTTRQSVPLLVELGTTPLNPPPERCCHCTTENSPYSPPLALPILHPTLSHPLGNTLKVKLMNETDRLEEVDSFNLTEAFSSGKVFSVDVLDSLMAAVSHQEA